MRYRLVSRWVVVDGLFRTKGYEVDTEEPPQDGEWELVEAGVDESVAKDEIEEAEASVEEPSEPEEPESGLALGDDWMAGYTSLNAPDSIEYIITTLDEYDDEDHPEVLELIKIAEVAHRDRSTVKRAIKALGEENGS